MGRGWMRVGWEGVDEGGVGVDEGGVGRGWMRVGWGGREGWMMRVGGEGGVDDDGGERGGG